MTETTRHDSTVGSLIYTRSKRNYLMMQVNQVVHWGFLAEKENEQNEQLF